jgi:hypothetical protein
MATFVRYPPRQVRDRVRIVSFFITARLAAQNTREAFTAVLLSQLADLTGVNPPSTLKAPAVSAHGQARRPAGIRNAHGTALTYIDVGVGNSWSCIGRGQ